ncbi:MAG: LIC_13387 family protein [Pyrinomonadaceae bacterium]
MLKRYTFWLTAAILFQLLTAALHSISFFVSPDLKNDTERQLHELITTYHPDMGGGFHPSFWNLFTALSSCLPLLCVLGGLTLGYLMLKQVSPGLMKGIIGINALIFGVAFVVMFVFAFLPPIICMGLIFVNLVIAYVLTPRIESAV